jgi:hypothetical protein
MKTIHFFIVSLTLLAGFTACKETNVVTEPAPEQDLSKYSNQLILDWNVAAFEAMGGAAYQHSLLASRINAMTHLAMHDALNAVAPKYGTYAFHEKNKDADPIAAAASAAYEVLIGSLPTQHPMLDERLAESLAQVVDGEAKTQGIALGKKVASAILALRQYDGAFDDPISPIPVSSQPGVYQAVPPFDFVFAPQWRVMPTFALQKADQFRSEPFPALNSERYTRDFDEVKRIGQKDSPYRDAEQTAIAKFWYEFSEIGWNRVTRAALAGQKLDLQNTARLFALVNMALADAYIAGWDSKFHYNLWRPYTAIRRADTDGNPNTISDPQWEPSEPTPPVQDYPSTHSALGNAAATVLAQLLGDKVEFTLESSTASPAGSTRTFNSFGQAALENAESRVLAGIHFRFACEKGLELGQKIGEWTVKNHLNPLKD